MSRIIIAVLLLAASIPAMADVLGSPGLPQPKPTEPPHVPPHSMCFNVVCQFDGKCEAASTFQKVLDRDGDEVEDRSEEPLNPVFEVSCNGETLFNGSGRRFTDRTGTRIQAEIGPYPALLLPRGALHDGHFYAPAALEFQENTVRGVCFIYTGPQ